MIDREYATITLNSGKRMLTIAFPDKEYALLSTFFFAEVEAFEGWIRQNIEEVLCGKAEERTISGTICELVITQRDTAISDALAEDGRGNWCSVPTRELLSMIDEWHERRAVLEGNQER
ncbi:MAG: hypothetical protein IKE22_10115 [Atopobiaceae bacterium]|nr:hypothetical protein [Atopobiaceae bacterium]